LLRNHKSVEFAVKLDNVTLDCLTVANKMHKKSSRDIKTRDTRKQPIYTKHILFAPLKLRPYGALQIGWWWWW